MWCCHAQLFKNKFCFVVPRDHFGNYSLLEIVIDVEQHQPDKTNTKVFQVMAMTALSFCYAVGEIKLHEYN